MDKSILILGAGIYQVPLIREAQARGFRAVIASIPGNYPGFAVADKVYYTDTTDKEAILCIAKQERVSAVVTTVKISEFRKYRPSGTAVKASV